MRNFLEGMTVVIIYIVAISLILTGLIVGRNSLAYRDVDFLKENAPEFVESKGFVIDGYVGYDGGSVYGGDVYYIGHRPDQPSIIYKFQVVEWRGELQMYTPKVINENIVVNKSNKEGE